MKVEAIDVDEVDYKEVDKLEKVKDEEWVAKELYYLKFHKHKNRVLIEKLEREYGFMKSGKIKF